MYRYSTEILDDCSIRKSSGTATRTPALPSILKGWNVMTTNFALAPIDDVFMLFTFYLVYNKAKREKIREFSPEISVSPERFF